MSALQDFEAEAAQRRRAEEVQAREVLTILARFETDHSIVWSDLPADELACRIADLIRGADSLTLMTALTGLTRKPFEKRP